MTALVIAEHDNQSIRKATLHAVTAAGKMGGEVHVLVAGHDCGAAAEAAGRIAGVAKVLKADDPAYAHALPENLANLAVSLGRAYSHIAAAATASGKNFLPRVAALLDVAQISDIISVESPDTFVRPIYAGNALATVQSLDPIKVVSVRTTGFDAAPASGGSAAIEAVAPAGDSGLASFAGAEITKSDRPELTAALG